MAGSTVGIAIEVQGAAQADAAVKVVKRSLEDLGASGVDAGTGIKVVKRNLDELGQGSAATAPSVQNLSSCMTSLESCSSLLRSSLQALLAVKLKDFFMESVSSTVMFAANVELANRALGVIGNSTGHTVAEMTKYRDALKEVNITTATATNVTTQFARSGLPLEMMNKLAAGAQGAAINYQMMTGQTISSSEALDKMVRSIQTGMVVELHQLGIMVSQKQIMKENGGQMDEYTRKQELLKAVVKELVPLNELYANSQDLAAKKISSAKRPIEELKLALGELFLPELTASATSFYETVSGGMKWVKEHAATLNILKQVIQEVCTGLQFAVVAVGVYTLAVLAATVATTNFGISAKLSAVWQMLQTEMTLTGAAIKTTTAVTGIMGETIVTSAERATIAMKSLNSACLVIAVALAAWEIGTLLTKFEWVRKAGVLMVYGVMGAWSEFVFMTQKFKVSWNPFGDEAEQQANLAKVEADRRKWLGEFKKNFSEQMKEQENPVTGSEAKPYQDNARILADGIKRAAAQKAEAALKDAEQAKELAEKQAKYDKQVQDATYAVTKQYHENALKLQADQTKDSLAQLQYEKETGLITVKSFIDAKYALERAASAQEVSEAEKLVSAKQKTLDAMKANPAVDNLMYKQEELKLAQAQGALQLAKEKQGNLEGEYWREAGKAIAAARTELEGYETKLKELSMTEAGKAQAKISDTYGPAFDKALMQQGVATNPTEQAAADKLVESIGALISEESRRATQQQLFGQQEAHITLLRAQGAVVEAQTQQEQLTADKALAAGKDSLVTADLKRVDAINAVKAAQDRSNVVTDMTSATGIINENDPYQKKLLQMNDAYQKEIRGTTTHLKEMQALRGSGAKKYLDDSVNIDADIAASSAWLAAKKQENDNNVLKANGQMTADYLNIAGQAFTALAETQDQSSRKGFETAKALNIGAAIMSTAAAIIGQLAGPDAALPSAWARAAIAGVMGAVQIAKIASTTFKGGGSASTAGASGSWGGAGGAASSVGAGISAPTTAIRDSQSQADFTRIAGSMENASIALVKVADGLTNITTLFDTGAGKYLGGALASPAGQDGNGGFLKSVGIGAASGFGLDGIFTFGITTAIGAAVGALGNAMFGWGNQWYTKASGVALGLQGGQLVGNNYDLRQKDGGWFSSDQLSLNSTAMNSKAEAAINNYLMQITAQVSRSAAVMGTTADLGSASLSSTLIQTSGRSAADIQKDLSAWLASAAATFAGTIKNLDQYIFPGEDKFTGLIRLATSLQGVNSELATIGGTLIEATLKGADFAYNLTQAFGGLDKLQAAMGTYRKAMFTDTEQEAMKAAGAGLQVTAAFAEMAIAVPVTKEAFKSLVNGLDLTTDRGRALLAALLGVSEAFGTVIDEAAKLEKLHSESSEDLATRLKAAQGLTAEAAMQKIIYDQGVELLDYQTKRLNVTELLIVQEAEYQKTLKASIAIMFQGMTALNSQLTGMQSVASALQVMTTQDASLSPAQKLQNSRGEYTRLLGLSRMTDPTDATKSLHPEALAQLGGAAQTYLSDTKAYYGASGSVYGALLEEVKTALGPLAGITGPVTAESVATQISTLQNISTAITTGDTNTLAELGRQTVQGSTLQTTIGQFLTAASTLTTNSTSLRDATAALPGAKDAAGLALRAYDTQNTNISTAVTTLAGLTDVTGTDPTSVIFQQKRGITAQSSLDDINAAIGYEIMNGWTVGPDQITAKNGRIQEVADAATGLSTARQSILDTTGLLSRLRDALPGLLQTKSDTAGEVTRLNGVIGNYAVGSPFIPADQLANIHQGEMIIDRRSADVLRSYGVPVTGSADNRDGVEEQQRTTAEIQALVRLQAAANQAIIDRLDASEDRLRTIENQGRWAA